MSTLWQLENDSITPVVFGSSATNSSTEFGRITCMPRTILKYHAWEIYVAFPKIFGKKFVFYSQPHVVVHFPTFFFPGSTLSLPAATIYMPWIDMWDDVAFAALQTPWCKTSAYFKWHPQKHGYPSWHCHVLPHDLSCFTQRPIKSAILWALIAEHTDIS